VEIKRYWRNTRSGFDGVSSFNDSRTKFNAISHNKHAQTINRKPSPFE
jgi:hypothetical protein